MGTAALWALMNLFIVADWGQTRYIAQHPQEYHEAFNPILGDHPSTRKVDAWFIGALATSNGIMFALPGKYRPYYAGVVGAVEAGFVLRNDSLGIRIRF